MKNALELYKKYHIDRDDERIGLFIELAHKYEIQNVLYPGSFVHITPSFIFPRVVYVDSNKQAAGFYKNNAIIDFIKRQKKYSANPQVIFHKADYSKRLDEKKESFDLLISQYAGFVSQACKKYLKAGGLLVANNSHGDASMAHLDKDYKFIGVYNRKKDKEYTISEANLDTYFIPKKSGQKITQAHLKKIQRGIIYTKAPSGYIFKKI